MRRKHPRRRLAVGVDGLSLSARPLIAAPASIAMPTAAMSIARLPYGSATAAGSVANPRSIM
jgi:hypothetical protein